MKIRTQSNWLVDLGGKVINTVRIPAGSFQILAYTKDKKDGCVLGAYSTEEKTLHVLSAIQVAANHPEKIRVFRMPKDAEVKA